MFNIVLSVKCVTVIIYLLTDDILCCSKPVQSLEVALDIIHEASCVKDDLKVCTYKDDQLF